jgi:uncharacterized protein YdeI (YjbR/CyaY-like superfamily)
MDLQKAKYFRDSEEWRRWLERYHDKEAEAWLLIQKKNSGSPGLGYQQALEEALCFGWIDGKMRSVDGQRFVLRFSPRRAKSIWSRVNREKAEKLIEAGRMTEAGLASIREAERNGMWARAVTNTNRKRDEIPPDLQAALAENETARANFHNFANSYRNMYVGWVADAKTEETRRRRIAGVVSRAYQNKKPGIS